MIRQLTKIILISLAALIITACIDKDTMEPTPNYKLQICYIRRVELKIYIIIVNITFL